MTGNQGIIDYEREVTRPERFFSRSPHSIVTIVLRIKGLVNEEMLRSAVEKVQQRHALLRVRITEDAEHVQSFTSEGADEIPVEVIPRENDQDWIEIQLEAIKKPFEFEKRPPIRFILVHSPQISEVIVLCHHIISDGMSLAYLARDLMVQLGDPDSEAQVLPAPAPINLDNLPEDISQSFIVKYFIRRMNRRWLKDAVFFDNQDYVELSQAYWESFDHNFLSIELTEEETSALLARCKEEKTTVNSALTAAFCGAQGIVEGKQSYHPRVVVAADLRERLPISPGEGFGMYAGGAELNFEFDHKRGFWDNARAFHEAIQPKYSNKQLFKNINNWLYLEPTILDAIPFKELGGLVQEGSARYARLSSFHQKEDVVLGIIQQEHLDSLEYKLWGTAVTNLGRLDFPSRYGELELERLIFQPGGGFPLANVNLVIGAVTCAGKLSIVVEYAQQAIDTGSVVKIKDQALAYLLGE